MKFIKFLVKMTNTTQVGMAKRVVGLLIAILVIVGLAKGKLNKQSLLNLK
jgi:hypothetical protein